MVKNITWPSRILLIAAFGGMVLAKAHAGPTNDNFADRLEISAPSYHFDGSITNATSETGKPLPPGMAQTLWWDFAPPASGLLQLTISGAQFIPILNVYDGTEFGSLNPLTQLPGTPYYYLESGHHYSIQLAAGVPGGNFSLDTMFYSQSNDVFATSDQVEGTNITYIGNFAEATLEPGEPVNGGTNTVWMSWTAPTNGYVTVNKLTAPQLQYYSVYTGSSVDQLVPVGLYSLGYNELYRFLVTAATTYHFQFSGGADTFTFNLQFQTFDPPSNDNFSNAFVVSGSAGFPQAAVDNATMEPGEPAHLGNVPQKSLWWKWQSSFYGNCSINSQGSLVSNLMIAAYTGPSVDALTLVDKTTNSVLHLPNVSMGQTYYIAAAVPTNSVGFVQLNLVYEGAPAGYYPPAGNLLQEPSWEGTGVLDAQYWKWSGGLSGFVNESGGANGRTWPVPAPGTTIWQDVPTIPGHNYAIGFACEIETKLGSGIGDALVAVLFDTNQLGVFDVPQSSWHWAIYAATASGTTSRVSFKNLGRNAGVDAFSMVDVSAPPSIVNQPVSISSIVGGTAIFNVGVTGPSLAFQWFFDDSPLAGQTNQLLKLSPVVPTQAGNYQVVITNAFGAVTSVVASLVVDAPSGATILSQPYGDTIPVGGYFNLSVVVGGLPPFAFQWYFNNQAVDGATNSNLMLPNVQLTDAGIYTVQASNQSSVVMSLPANLNVVEAGTGGGVIDFRNKNFFSLTTNINAIVFDVDGVTPLSGSGYVAQLYAGPSLNLLRPAGQPTPFRTGANAGYFLPQMVTLANVAPGDTAVLQVCAWDATFGSSYEQARATGGKFGKSAVLQVMAGGDAIPPQTMQGLQSFSLQAGLPFFQVGSISYVGQGPTNTLVWALHGQAGSIYLIEKSKRSEEAIWHPFTILTNATGTVTFTDTAESGAVAIWYRARILD